MITNTGGRDVVINKLAVRGQTSAWTDVYYLMAATDDTGLTADLPHLDRQYPAELQQAHPYRICSSAALAEASMNCLAIRRTQW